MGADVGAGAARGCSRGPGRASRCRAPRDLATAPRSAVEVGAARGRRSGSARPGRRSPRGRRRSPRRGRSLPCSGPRQAAGSLMRTVALQVGAGRAEGAAAPVLDDLDLAAADAARSTAPTAVRASASLTARRTPSAASLGVREVAGALQLQPQRLGVDLGDDLQRHRRVAGQQSRHQRPAELAAAQREGGVEGLGAPLAAGRRVARPRLDVDRRAARRARRRGRRRSGPSPSGARRGGVLSSSSVSTVPSRSPRSRT